MHHATVERWSRAGGWLHSRDPRTKISVLLLLLIAIGTQDAGFAYTAPIYLALLLLAGWTTRLPLMAIIARSALILPFPLTFGIITAAAGDPRRAELLIAKSYLSALAALLLIATTPLPEILNALAAFRLPAYLLTVTQFLYRYLFVVSQEAQHMRIALAARGSRTLATTRRLGFHAASGIVASLFARSYQRAQNIHHSMLSRGFDGALPSLHQPHLHRADVIFAIAAGLAILAMRCAPIIFPNIV